MMLEEYNEWSNDQKVKFLARLSHELTVCARSTYEPGTMKVLQPELLRAYNEIQHRVTASLRDLLLEKSGMALSTVLEMLRDFGTNYDRTSDIEGAIASVLQRMSGIHPMLPG